MAIYDILNEVEDLRRSENGICTFNGFLEDYLSLIEGDETKAEAYDILQALLEQDNNLKIASDLQLNINRNAIANQIIRYKDAFKLPKGTIRVPYLLYGTYDGRKGPVQKAMILTLGDKEEYILAKALYYVMSEPENEYEGTRNEIIAASATKNTIERLVKTLDAFFLRDFKAGILQRNLDMEVFDAYEDMYALAQEMGNGQKASLQETLDNAQDTEQTIYAMISKWFLLKKFSYVQYMMDKNTLTAVHEGNVKKQRQVAKEKSDRISFVSFSEMWKMKRK